MKLIVVLIAFLLLFFGCTNTEETKGLEEIQAEFGATESFPTDLIIMQAYLNEISLLKSKTNIPNPSLDSEIVSAQAFYYFSKALNESKSITYINHCKSIEYNNTLNYLKLAINYSQKINGFESFSRPNQAQIIKGINVSSKEMLSSLEETC